MNIYADRALQFLTIVGWIDAAVLVVVVLTAVVLWFRGIVPALWRLGSGLARRKIVIFAKGDQLTSLRDLLIDSKLFRKGNIESISRIDDIGRAQDATVYLVWWSDWAADIDAILGRKPDSAPLIVYAPYEQPKLTPAEMTKLDGHRNTAITNFRGRLLNDVVTSMITTAYKQ